VVLISRASYLYVYSELEASVENTSGTGIHFAGTRIYEYLNVAYITTDNAIPVFWQATWNLAEDLIQRFMCVYIYKVFFSEGSPERSDLACNPLCSRPVAIYYLSFRLIDHKIRALDTNISQFHDRNWRCMSSVRTLSEPSSLFLFLSPSLSPYFSSGNSMCLALASSVVSQRSVNRPLLALMYISDTE
jgi:hypothetical protein